MQAAARRAETTATCLGFYAPLEQPRYLASTGSPIVGSKFQRGVRTGPGVRQSVLPRTRLQSRQPFLDCRLRQGREPAVARLLGVSSPTRGRFVRPFFLCSRTILRPPRPVHRNFRSRRGIKAQWSDLGTFARLLVRDRPRSAKNKAESRELSAFVRNVWNGGFRPLRAARERRWRPASPSAASRRPALRADARARG